MHVKDFDLDGQVAIVTGSTRGVGKGIAIGLAEAGADVVISDILPEIEETAEEIRKLGRRSLAVHTDVTSTEQVDEMVDRTVKELGSVDILVANAGIDIKKPLLLFDGKPPLPMRVPDVQLDSPLREDEWERMIDINLKGYVRCARAAGRYMTEQKSGSIIGIGSLAGIRHSENGVIYGATKAGVHQVSQGLALEWAQFNIRVNALALGAFGPTESWYVKEWNVSREAHDVSIRKLEGRIPLKRFGSPRELGLICAFLCSRAGSYITGQVLTPDGGVSLAY